MRCECLSRNCWGPRVVWRAGAEQLEEQLRARRKRRVHSQVQKFGGHRAMHHWARQYRDWCGMAFGFSGGSECEHHAGDCLPSPRVAQFEGASLQDQSSAPSCGPESSGRRVQLSHQSFNLGHPLCVYHGRCFLHPPRRVWLNVFPSSLQQQGQFPERVRGRIHS